MPVVRGVSVSENHREAARSQSEPTLPQFFVVLTIIAMFVWVALSLIGIVNL
jgi:hypothetical protein